LLLPESVRRLNTAAQAVEAEQARLAAERREMETEKLAARDLARQYAQKLDALKKKESAFVDKETEALWDAIRKAREAVRDAEKSIKRRSADPAAIKTARTDINRIAAELEKGGTLSSSAKSSLPGRTATPADIVPGAPVHIISMGKAGIVEVPLKGNTVTAKVNNVRMRVSIDDVRILDSRPADRPSTAHRPLTGPLLAGDAIRTSANTLDLRGATVEEGAARVDAFLDRALRQQTDVVYILTGFGTGALTTGIRRHLERSPYVETHRPGNEGEGGDAVTAVFLR